MTNTELTQLLENTHAEIADLRQKIERLESNVGNRSTPQLYILNQNFLTRAFAVYGHVVVAGLFVAVPFLLCSIVAGSM